MFNQLKQSTKNTLRHVLIVFCCVAYSLTIVILCVFVGQLREEVRSQKKQLAEQRQYNDVMDETLNKIHKLHDIQELLFTAMINNQERCCKVEADQQTQSKYMIITPGKTDALPPPLPVNITQALRKQDRGNFKDLASSISKSLAFSLYKTPSDLP